MEGNEIVAAGFEGAVEPVTQPGLRLRASGTARTFHNGSSQVVRPRGRDRRRTATHRRGESPAAGASLHVLFGGFLQPIYTFTFSNGLIACLVFMGIGVITDIGYMLISPFRSMFIALCAELGTLLTFPIAVAMGLTY
jgi:Na+-transporting methylmalonyl-CoA/oxaloacetate decarboxylase beta subunit